MTTPNGRPRLDAWFARTQELTEELQALHDAGEHRWCPSLPLRRSEHLRWRLNRVLIAGRFGQELLDWVKADVNGLRFADLDHKVAEKLIRALESRDGRW